jgi:deazaflavin-dependent oxidoreductase (nitroreductase family)
MGSSNGPRFVPRVHRWLYRRTGGRLGHGIIGVPALLLHTIGSRSGLLRTAALVYGRDGTFYVVAASNYGGDRDPAWLDNIRANSRVRLQVARRQVEARARIVGQDDPDYARLLAVMNGVNRNRYDLYRARTARPIPFVVMGAAGGPTGAAATASGTTGAGRSAPPAGALAPKRPPRRTPGAPR